MRGRLKDVACDATPQDTGIPELPDITVYVEAVAARTVGRPLERLRVASPFVLRTAEPPAQAFAGRSVTEVRRIGKRVVLGFTGDYCAVIHLMIAGRLHWKPAGAKLPGRAGLAAFDFAHGALTFTEAGSKHRASLHLVSGASALAALDPGGLEPLDADVRAFSAALTRENHTVKRALTDPSIFSGIGNAYSDEILHAAKLSPLAWTSRLDADELARLHQATRDVLLRWTQRLRSEAGQGFPEGVTAFREGMAVHGRYRQPCPVCGSPVQRIRYAANEANYCAHCQTGGRVLADRSLSRLLKDDWPRSLEAWEERILGGRGGRR